MQSRLEQLMHRRVIYTVTDQDGIYTGTDETRKNHAKICTNFYFYFCDIFRVIFFNFTRIYYIRLSRRTFCSYH